MKILAIETSCDETACAVVEDGHRVLADQVATQIEVHRKYGGVVPELASRNHVVDVVPVVQAALAEAGLTFADLDAIAVTRGPGLVGALLVGLQVAKSIAWAHDLALIPVNHLAGHLHAVYLHRPGEPEPAPPAHPHLALAVSGGHTALYRVEGRGGPVRLVANTRDDAAGEAFDKVARLLGLGYPGGPTVERLARGGDARAHAFPLPRFKEGNPLDFSFSGLKTAVLTVLERRRTAGLAVPEGPELADLLASFQQAAVDQLADRVVRAAQEQGIDDVVLAGGVACNTCLRTTLRDALAAQGRRLHVPPPRWCTDNAAMIAAAAWSAVGPNAHHRPEDRRLNAVGTWPVYEPA